MRTKQRAAIALIKNNQLLVIRRQKNGSLYYVLPGGGVESGESPAAAAKREIKEELGLEAELKEKIAEFENRGQLEHYYLSDNYRGKIKFTGDNGENPNIFDREEWIEIDNLNQINLLPDKIKAILIDLFKRNQKYVKK